MFSKLPYRQYAIGALFRGRDVTKIGVCLRNTGLSVNFPIYAEKLRTSELFKDAKKYRDSKDPEERQSISDKYGVTSILRHMLEITPEWRECWDLMSVRKYREYLLVLASIPTLDSATITESFNKKFSRSMSKRGVSLLLSTFWDLTGLSTSDIKQAVDDLADMALRNALNKLLFGDAVAAAKSVGATLRLNYGLILEEMLADAYLRYKEKVDSKAPYDEIRQAANSVMKIGDRVNKLSKRDIDADVLHNLLSELKLETELATPVLSDFKKKNSIV